MVEHFRPEETHTASEKILQVEVFGNVEREEVAVFMMGWKPNAEVYLKMSPGDALELAASLEMIADQIAAAR